MTARAQAAEVKEHGRENDLVARVRGDAFFAPIHDDLDALLEKIVPAALSGTAKLELHEAGKITYTLRMPNSQFF